MVYYGYNIGIILTLLIIIAILINRINASNKNKKYMYDEEMEDKVKDCPYNEDVSISKKILVNMFDNSYRSILKCYDYIDKEVKNKNVIPAAGEWLLDNLYLVQREYKNARKQMVKSRNYKNLPIISKGKKAGCLRIYYVAIELIKATNGNLNKESIEKFINEYQSNCVLTSSELWVLPAMIKIALIQGISKISDNIFYIQKEKNKADKVSEKIIISNGDIEKLTDIFNMKINFSIYFAERLIRNLKDNGIENNYVYKWIDDNLSIKEIDLEKIMILEQKKQAAFRLTMGNSINSIREISLINWRESFEKLSYVEKVLRKDPLNVYENMDFKSRNYYRNAIEKMAQKYKLRESFIAKKALESAKENENAENYLKHIGYYLVDDGLDYFLRKINVKSRRDIFNKRERKVNTYIQFITITTIIISLGICYTYFNRYRNEHLWKYIVGFLLILTPVSEIIITITNWGITHLVKPSFIPKLEFKENIPREYTTAVVIPTLLTSKKVIKKLIEDLEVYYIANKSDNVYYAILGDFKDDTQQKSADDDELIKYALREITNLNKKYCKNKNDVFYVLNRYRKFNKQENLWMGWERKRGKLIEFNKLIRGHKDTSYDVISGDIKKLEEVKYVITLDADTQLPRNAVFKLVGAMTHILNKPYIDNDSKKVLRGYGIMQPRISVSILSANKTTFSKLFCGETGIDRYTCAISDVYQDLFNEGIFTGKGIYNVDVFNYLLDGEIKENKVLSHDLLEGSYLRTALITDVELIDDYPSYYNSSAKRLHRWVRGDWQLISWISRVSPLNRLSKWKIFDNLRRSVVAPSIIILFIVSILLFRSPDTWIVTGFITIIIPLLFDISESVIIPLRGISLSGKIKSWKVILEQFFLIFSFLPYQCYLMLDAIIRSLYRMCISKMHLLEWQTSADANNSSARKLKDYIRCMWVGSAISVFIAIVSFNNSQTIGKVMLPSCIIWFISPWIAYVISKDKVIISYNLNKEEKKLLGVLSYRIWSYFSDFVGEDTNWLAPDNYQCNPENGIAYRTSPTNIAMGLVSNIVAFDLGYINLDKCVYRLNSILKSMEDLEKYEGHFYNWYDIKTKKPLYPRYVSTVDSGNLLSYLWLIENSMNEFKNINILGNKFIDGSINLINLCKDELPENTDMYNHMKKELKIWKGNLSSLNMMIQNVLSKIEPYIGVENNYWNKKLYNVCLEYKKGIYKLFPWVDLLNDTEIKQEIMSFRLYADDTSLLNVLDFMIKDYGLNDFILNLDKLIEMLDKNKLKFTQKLSDTMKLSRKELNKIHQNIKLIYMKCNEIGEKMNFKFLFDENRQLFHIGFDVERGVCDGSYYDLLASEARQASFVAIAKGDIDQFNWFNLGRSLTSINGNKGLTSWSGTMFEYLMPLLIMKRYPDTLLDSTYKFVVKTQKYYGDIKNVPWGISESGFYTFDVGLNYQYKAFGVPGIGLKRGLSDDLVIAPYASIMALQVDKVNAFNNIKRLIKEGFQGRYGLFEAIDFTKSRIPKGNKFAIVESFMVHHEGMSIMALDNVLNDNILQKRFHKDPRVKSTELLLQEKIPNNIVYDRQESYKENVFVPKKIINMDRKYGMDAIETPKAHFLSNGSYSIMVTNRGSGYSKNEDLMLYRWKEDITNDNLGMFFYIKNLNSNDYWSNTFIPCKNEGEDYNVTFSLDNVNFKRIDGNIETVTNICVSNEDNVEIRKITLKNNSNSTRELDVTSYCEVTLNRYNADLVHPAFANLFISTEFIEEENCLLANRRKRESNGKEYWAMETVAIMGEVVGNIQYETSRLNFIGRCRDLDKPEIIEEDKPLTNTVGAVLDPILSMRVRVKIPAGEECIIAYSLGFSHSRENAVGLCKKYKDWGNINRIFELATTQNEIQCGYLGIKSGTANLYQDMASDIVLKGNNLIERQEYIKSINRQQSDLWSYGISGDLPIVLLIVKKEEDTELVNQLVKAHEYWSLKGIKVDLIILNMEEVSYIQQMQNSINGIFSNGYAKEKQNKSAGIFVYNKSTMSEDIINLLKAISKIVINSDKGSLWGQIKAKYNLQDKKEKFINYNPIYYSELGEKLKCPKLNYFNGIGGFDVENEEYVIALDNYKNTPAPWINVITNGNIGFHVSEGGTSYTWSKNSRENKITTWSNDPIKDNEGEFIYIRDEVTGEFWSISPKPIRDKELYLINHGFGYSIFKHKAKGILGEITMFVPMKDNLKVSLVKLKNETNVERKLSMTYYSQLVLGVVPEQTSNYISTYLDEKGEYIYAKNPYNREFSNLIAYLKVSGGMNISYTGNRNEFIGGKGTIDSPYGLRKEFLSNNVGAGLDPCIAINTKISIKPNEEKYLVAILGEEDNIKTINTICEKYTNEDYVLEELKKVKKYWKDILGTITIKTPDETMNLLVNGWLMYQVIACRFLARTAFYQSGGAYGFRDQLQDSIAISYIDPKITRNHILYSASRQFLQGDVQHWWHPVVDSGIRTRFSDDLLWLPYVTMQYIKNTGDYTILDEEVSYLDEEPLKEGEDERYDVSKKSNVVGSIYEHCIKAIDRSLKFGPHNIPLMGSGDWNDGMSTVGNKGIGESVWLGWFIYSILNDFKYICKRKNDSERAEEYEKKKEFIAENLEKNAWDGNWYRRAYFDDGTPLGSAENEECEIDSLSQSWAVISGAAREARAKEAILSVERYLVKKDEGLVKLLTPAFYKSSLEPGYIKGYVPGVRENGGQYTHATIWYILALTKLHFNDKAVDIFNMINPINHTLSYFDCQRYKVEPYVVSADVYAVEPHVGRGGWSWYTGAAGWMYTTAINGILGFTLSYNSGFMVRPNIPNGWSGFEIKYKKDKCIYNISVVRGEKEEIYLDDIIFKEQIIPFFKEGEHNVKVVIK